MISTAKRFLNRPFPYDTSIFNKWKIALVFGSFIAAFLIVFAPFGLHEVPAYLRATYGVVTFFALESSRCFKPTLGSGVFQIEH